MRDDIVYQAVREWLSAYEQDHLTGTAEETFYV